MSLSFQNVEFAGFLGLGIFWGGRKVYFCGFYVCHVKWRVVVCVSGLSGAQVK